MAHISIVEDNDLAYQPPNCFQRQKNDASTGPATAWIHEKANHGLGNSIYVPAI